MNRRNAKIHRKDIALFVGALVLAIVLLSLAVRVIDRTITQQTETETTETESVNTETVLTVDDVNYIPRQRLRSYLFLGIDRDGPAKGSVGYNDGGQADVLFLLVIDDANQTWQLLHINRDSMVDVPVLGLYGIPVNSCFQQIALSHAYGDGTHNSCRNTVRAVSDMLMGQSINGYFALNMGGISILNDFVGGVTVTIDSDFSEVDPSLVMGQTITLNGQQAYNFIRSRRNVDNQTNLSRMQRHRQYMAGLTEKLHGLSEEDILRGYDALFDYMITDIGSRTMTEFSELLETYTQLETLTVDGETYRDDEGQSAFRLDEDCLMRVILQMFYIPKNSEM